MPKKRKKPNAKPKAAASKDASAKLPMGRPPLYAQKEIRDKILDALELGLPYAKAALWAGIDEETLRLWRNMEKPPPDATQEIADFFGDLKKVEVGGEMARIRSVIRGDQGWQGAAWWLERVKGYVKPQPIAPTQAPQAITIKFQDDD